MKATKLTLIFMAFFTSAVFADESGPQRRHRQAPPQQEDYGDPQQQYQAYDQGYDQGAVVGYGQFDAGNSYYSSCNCPPPMPYPPVNVYPVPMPLPPIVVQPIVPAQPILPPVYTAPPVYGGGGYYGGGGGGFIGRPTWGGQRPGWGGGPRPAPYARGGYRHMSLDSGCEVVQNKDNPAEYLVLSSDDGILYRDSSAHLSENIQAMKAYYSNTAFCSKATDTTKDTPVEI